MIVFFVDLLFSSNKGLNKCNSHLWSLFFSQRIQVGIFWKLKP